MDIFNKIKEKGEQSKIFRWGRNVICVAVIIVSIVVLYLGITNYQNNTNLQSAALYNEALSGNKELIIPKLQKIAKENSIYGSLANLKLGDIYAQKNDFDKSAYHYKKVSENDNTSPIYKEYANLATIKAMIIGNKISNARAIQILQDYINLDKEKKYFYNIATLMLAAILKEEGKNNQAYQKLNYITTNRINNTPSFFNLAEVLQKSIKIE